MSAIALNLESSCIAIVYCSPCGVCGLSYGKHLFKNERFFCDCDDDGAAADGGKRLTLTVGFIAFLFPAKKGRRRRKAVIFFHGPPPQEKGGEGGKGTIRATEALYPLSSSSPSFGGTWEGEEGGFMKLLHEYLKRQNTCNVFYLQTHKGHF